MFSQLESTHTHLVEAYKCDLEFVLDQYSLYRVLHANGLINSLHYNTEINHMTIQNNSTYGYDAYMLSGAATRNATSSGLWLLL